MWSDSYHNMVTVPHKMDGLEGMLYYRGVGLQMFHCMHTRTYMYVLQYMYLRTFTVVIVELSLS